MSSEQSVPFRREIVVSLPEDICASLDTETQVSGIPIGELVLRRITSGTHVLAVGEDIRSHFPVDCGDLHFQVMVAACSETGQMMEFVVQPDPETGQIMTACVDSDL